MQKTKQLEMYRRVRDFGQTNSSLFANNSQGKKLFTELNHIITSLEQHTAVQTTQRNEAKQKTITRNNGRKDLLTLMKKMQRTAKVLSYDDPGLEGKFRLKSSVDDETLLSTARAFAVAAKPISAAFIRLDMPSDFLKQLDTLTKAVSDTISLRSSADSAKSGATSVLQTQFAAGMRTVEALHVAVTNKHSDDLQLIATWNTAKRISHGYKGGNNSNTGETKTTKNDKGGASETQS